MNALQNTTGRKGTSWGRRLQAIARRTSWNLHSLFSRDRPSKRSTRLVCEQLESREVHSPVPGSAIYSHDGRHRAWIDQDKVGQRVFSADIIKGADRNIQIGRYFYQIYDLSYSPNSSNLAFFGRDGAWNNYRWSNWVRYCSYGSFQKLGG